MSVDTQATNGRPHARKLAVLVTGASGLLGAHIVRLLSQDERVGRLISAGRSAANGAVEGAAGERLILDLERDVDVPRGIDVLIHAAGEKRDTSRQMAVNAEGTRRLAEAAARAGVGRFVHVSSVGVYGTAPSSGTVSELQPHRPQNSYEHSKDRGETLLREACSSSGLDFVILQPTTVLGVAASSYPLLGMMKAVRAGYFSWFGSARAWTNYVSVEDVASAVVTAMDRARGGGTYIVNTPAPLADLVAWIAEETGVAAPRRTLPLWVGKLGAELGAALKKAGRPIPFDRERLLELTNTTIYDGSAFIRATGHRYPLGIQAAIRALARRYGQDGLL